MNLGDLDSNNRSRCITMRSNIRRHLCENMCLAVLFAWNMLMITFFSRIFFFFSIRHCFFLILNVVTIFQHSFTFFLCYFMKWVSIFVSTLFYFYIIYPSEYAILIKPVFFFIYLWVKLSQNWHQTRTIRLKLLNNTAER